MARRSGDDLTDPSATHGYQIVVDKACPVALHFTAESDDKSCLAKVGKLEPVTMKVLVKLDASDIIRAVRIELSSEDDVFFFYTGTITEGDFGSVKQQQSLTLEFTGYSELLVKIINDCIDKPQLFCASLILRQVGTARLYFQHNVGYKMQECLSVALKRPSVELIHKQITYRYKRIKQELSNLKVRWATHAAAHKFDSPRGGGGGSHARHLADSPHARRLATNTAPSPYRAKILRAGARWTPKDSSRSSNSY